MWNIKNLLNFLTLKYLEFSWHWKKKNQLKINLLFRNIYPQKIFLGVLYLGKFNENVRKARKKRVLVMEYWLKVWYEIFYILGGEEKC